MFSQVIVRAKHIHSNDFHLTTNGSIVDRMIVCVLPSRTVMILSFSKSCEIKLIFPLLKAYSSQVIISGRWEKSCLKWKSLSLRMTVEVEMESWWTMSVIEVFSISFWAIFWLIIRGIWWFFLKREISDTAIFEQW